MLAEYDIDLGLDEEDDDALLSMQPVGGDGEGGEAQEEDGMMAVDKQLRQQRTSATISGGSGFMQEINSLWSNEASCPDLLPFQHTLVAQILRKIKRQVHGNQAGTEGREVAGDSHPL